MNRSEQINDLVTALATAQGGMSGVKKNRTVSVETERGSYSFDYATLDNIIEEVRGPLTTNGLWFTQTLESGDEGKYRLVTTLMHKSGQWLASETPIVVQDGKNKNQMFGSALTYMRRYALSAMLGIASEDDDDANEADGNKVQARRDKGADASGNGSKTAKPNGKSGRTPAQDWVEKSIEKINIFETRTRLSDWCKINESYLELLSQQDQKLHERLTNLIDDRMAALKG